MMTVYIKVSQYFNGMNRFYVYYIVNSCALILHAVFYCSYYLPVLSSSAEIQPGVGFSCLMFILRTCVIMLGRKTIQSKLQLTDVHVT